MQHDHLCNLTKVSGGRIAAGTQGKAKIQGTGKEKGNTREIYTYVTYTIHDQPYEKKN